MKKEKSTNITIAVVLMVIFLFSVISIDSTFVKKFTYNLTSQLGNAVGIVVGVPENPYSKLAQELDVYESEVKDREVILLQRELEVVQKENKTEKSNNLLLISVGLLLSVLILVNFYLDWKRGGVQVVKLKKID